MGAIIVNESLAKTFETIAEAGPGAFYTGALAQEIASTVADDTPHAGAMTPADIAGYEAKEREPVCGSYRAYRICAMGPPTSGGVAVLQMLGQLERFDLAEMGLRNPRTWHLFVESQRLAYADRELYLADSDFVSVPLPGLVDPEYLAGRSALIAADARLAEAQPGTPPGADRSLADGDEPEEPGTSHFAVVDGSGVMISYTSTIEGAFGSGLMAGGFFLNNELTDFSRSPEVDGRPVANRVEPASVRAARWRRPWSTIRRGSPSSRWELQAAVPFPCRPHAASSVRSISAFRLRKFSRFPSSWPLATASCSNRAPGSRSRRKRFVRSATARCWFAKPR